MSSSEDYFQQWQSQGTSRLQKMLHWKLIYVLGVCWSVLVNMQSKHFNLNLERTINMAKTLCLIYSYCTCILKTGLKGDSVRTPNSAKIQLSAEQ